MKLLNGTKTDKDELIKRMRDDSFYYGELNRLALSSSSIKLLLDSPKTYHYVTKYGNTETDALRSGWLFHAAILEPEVFNAQNFVNVQSKNTKLYKEAKDELGKVFTIKEKEEAERMADAFLKNQKAVSLIANCQFEVPTIGEVMGYAFRGKADVLGVNKIVDIKTTSDIKSFPYSAKKYGYDVQAFVYCELFDVAPENFTFLVLDKGSLDIGVFNISMEFYLEGGRKTEMGIERYKAFFEDEGDLDQYYIEDTL